MVWNYKFLFQIFLSLFVSILFQCIIYFEFRKVLSLTYQTNKRTMT